MVKLLNKTRQLELWLRHEILRGDWQPGSKFMTEEQLIRKFGVSTSTLREALNTLMAAGIVERRHGSGTYILRTPENLVVIFADLVNLVSPAGYWFRNLIDDLREVFEQSGFKIELAVGHGSTEAERLACFRRLIQRLPVAETTGFIALTPMGELKELLEAFGCPFLSIHSVLRDGTDSIVLDYHAIAQVIPPYMRSLGHPDFRIVAIEDSAQKAGSAFCSEYRRFLEQLAGGNPERLIVAPEIDSVYQVFRQYVDRAGLPGAIYFADDSLFDCCGRFFLEEHIEIPGDVLVVSHGNKRRHSNLPWSVPRIGFDRQEVVTLAHRLFLERRNSPELEAREFRITPQML